MIVVGGVKTNTDAHAEKKRKEKGKKVNEKEFILTGKN
jgi:hypothetical protein